MDTATELLSYCLVVGLGTLVSLLFLWMDR